MSAAGESHGRPPPGPAPPAHPPPKKTGGGLVGADGLVAGARIGAAPESLERINPPLKQREPPTRRYSRPVRGFNRGEAGGPGVSSPLSVRLFARGGAGGEASQPRTRTEPSVSHDTGVCSLSHICSWERVVAQSARGEGHSPRLAQNRGPAPSSRSARPAPATRNRPVVIASKPFAESYILAEMFAQLLEARGIAVDRRPGLGATEIAFGALRTGAVDVYPEYTGTGLLAILNQKPEGDAGAVYGRVSREFAARWDMHWLPPLGFENTYAIAVRRETAAKYKLRTLSDLARAAPQLTAGLTPDFIGRDDGLLGLQAAYGLRLRSVRPLVQAVKYPALAESAVDVIDGYSTDGMIDRYQLTVLEDDRAFFPPYEAAAMVSSRLWRERPDAVAQLTLLSGRLDVATMRALNRRVEVDGVPVARVAADALRALGLGGSASSATARTETTARRGSFGAYLWARRGELGRLTLRHLMLVLVSLSAAAAVAVPAGVLLGRAHAGAAEGAVRGVGLLQTIPGIALLAFMIPLLGIGTAPALAALFLYSLYPIIRNSYTGVRDADPRAVEAARALGMSGGQVLRQVRLPLAAPSIMAGVRTSAVIAVGTATLAAFIGAGGLGDPIVAGLALSDTRMILSGAIPAALLALLVDAMLAIVERAVRPRGLG
ncbi:glycine betaine ABC transporter substrate-binding protein [Longimicrobium terrae]|nr:glycine betaine ABC transporter substrate-binding protein [Longimicrobium terrae]